MYLGYFDVRYWIKYVAATAVYAYLRLCFAVHMCPPYPLLLILVCCFSSITHQNTLVPQILDCECCFPTTKVPSADRYVYCHVFVCSAVDSHIHVYVTHVVCAHIDRLDVCRFCCFGTWYVFVCTCCVPCPY